MGHSVLIVDDEKGIRQSLTGVLEDEGFVAQAVESGEACLEALGSRAYDCILLDVWLPGMSGIETLATVRELYSDVAVVMISGHGTIDTAVQATKLGAFDFIEKPLSLEKTLLTVKNAIKQKTLEREAAQLRHKLIQDYEMIGQSVSMRALRHQIVMVAPTDGRAIIYGESGSGKELVARAIHAQSSRAERPFVEMNCSAIPDELIESELFGHVKGAFTGASMARQGKFEQADGATLFLDEIGDMSLKTQAKILRVLEEGRVQPVGSNAWIAVNARIIAATNKRIREMIERGEFREDLFYRLNVIPFYVPPLRERPEDVPLLVEHFNQRFSAAYNRTPKQFTEAAIEKLQHYDWPGNVRELKNTVERIVIMRSKMLIDVDDLPRLAADPMQDSLSSIYYRSFQEAAEAFERQYIQRKLAECEGNVTRAAESMGIDRSHLYRRMKTLGISPR
ncbi:MAG: sigma-54-dependent Fis family transcriptional regulator [Acidobacteria bacterium]|nr:sigma-54-dependent Fis family transcriptional regulator [Acidobacteriota bacterium]